MPTNNNSTNNNNSNNSVAIAVAGAVGGIFNNAAAPATQSANTKIKPTHTQRYVQSSYTNTYMHHIIYKRRDIHIGEPI